MARVLLLVLAASLAALASSKGLPVLAPVTKDTATSLYTIPFHDGANLVLDVAGPLVWSTCDGGQPPAEIPCSSPTCLLANAYPAPGCPAPSCGSDRHDKPCTAYPYNPVTGACAAGSLFHTKFVANTTDGNKPVSKVNVGVVAACAPSKLLASLPRGSTGVAGLADSGLALPAQVASAQKVANRFLLCLPTGGLGVAIFGGGPLPWPQFTQSMDYTPLVAKGGSPAHYISLKSIKVENTRVPVSERALATGGVMLSTRLPYVLLRRDVYRPLVDAFTKALAAQPANGAPVARAVKPVAPFELCYDTKSLGNNLGGYWVPNVGLAVDGGSDWAMTGKNSMVDVKPGTACVAFVEMKGVEAGDGRAPAAILGGAQMEDFVLDFDMEKKRLGFSRLPQFTGCSSFNFAGST
ncbi:chitinase CLP [Aegilops tauschii subsp. strangulata]|uniref:Peptidase A1 domain-containing protein n=1 Tax=Aegilops tauschii subsp. strangulata TaxID=200361 RepID=A0A453GJU3_AEGTS|nr:chitinase CLP [Aegilops tauschii subsp. strangulata]